MSACLPLCKHVLRKFSAKMFSRALFSSKAQSQIQDYVRQPEVTTSQHNTPIRARPGHTNSRALGTNLFLRLDDDGAYDSKLGRSHYWEGSSLRLEEITAVESGSEKGISVVKSIRQPDVVVLRTPSQSITYSTNPIRNIPQVP